MALNTDNFTAEQWDNFNTQLAAKWDRGMMEEAAAPTSSVTPEFLEELRQINTDYGDTQKYDPRGPDRQLQYNKEEETRAQWRVHQLLRDHNVDADDLVQGTKGSDNDLFLDLGVGNNQYGRTGDYKNKDFHRITKGQGGVGTYGTAGDYSDGMFNTPFMKILAGGLAPFTGGLSIVAQQAARAASGETLHGGDYAQAAGAYAGGAFGGGVGDNMVNWKNVGQSFRNVKDTVDEIGDDKDANDTPISDGLFGGLDSGILDGALDSPKYEAPPEIPPYEDQTAPWIGGTPVSNPEGGHWVKDSTSASGWKVVPNDPDELTEEESGGGGGTPAGGGAPMGGPSAPPSGSQRDPNTSAKGTEVQIWQHQNPDGTWVAGDETGDVWEIEAPEETGTSDDSSVFDDIATGIILGGGISDDNPLGDSTVGGGGLTLGGYEPGTGDQGIGESGTGEDGIGDDGTGEGDGGDGNGDGSGDGSGGAQGQAGSRAKAELLKMVDMPWLKRLPPAEQLKYIQAKLMNLEQVYKGKM